MDRQIIYPGQIPLETDLLNTNKNTMIALSKLAAAVLGTTMLVNGLSVGPNSPAALNVVVSPGEVYALANVDTNPYSSLAADTTHLVMKQGVALDAVTVACPAPTTSGFSINYLIQTAFTESDGLPVTLPYYNASNPSQAFSGPGNNGAAQNTRRFGIVVTNAKAGTAAPTGSQTTPSPDPGFVALAIVTVAYGQTTITTTSIAVATTAPVIPSGGLLPAVQASSLTVAADVGAANVCVVNYQPPVYALTDGMVLWFKAKAANTGATTLNVNGLGAFPLIGGAHQALTGGEIIPNGKCQVVWRADINSFILVECTGGALQVSPGININHGAQFGQLTGVVGSARNLKASVSGAAASSVAYTADEIIVESALGGLQYKLSSFSQTLNVATTGIGGMDTGSAPVSGYVAIYAAYNPSTKAVGIFAQNAPALAVMGNVYGGANLPAGYTATALIGIWPTNGSGQLIVGNQFDRTFCFVPILLISTATQQATYSGLNATPAIPANAKTCRPTVSITCSSTGGTFVAKIASASSGIGEEAVSGVSAVASAGVQVPLPHVQITSAQQLFYVATASAGTMTFSVQVSEYTF